MKTFNQTVIDEMQAEAATIFRMAAIFRDVGRPQESLERGEAAAYLLAGVNRLKQEKAKKSVEEGHIHTCSYYCEKPGCVKAQRDALREKLFVQDAKLLDDIQGKLSKVTVEQPAVRVSLTDDQAKELWRRAVALFSESSEYGFLNLPLIYARLIQQACGSALEGGDK